MNPTLVPPPFSPWGIAVSGSNLFITNYYQGTIGEYDTSGAVVNASLVSGLNGPSAIAVSGSNLFVTNARSGTIGEYTTSGAVVNASLVSGLSYPAGIAVTQDVPEPSSVALLFSFVAVASLGRIGYARRRRRTKLAKAPRFSPTARPLPIATVGGMR